MNAPDQSQKSPGREAAEAIARAHGVAPKIIGPVKMIGTATVDEFLRGFRAISYNAITGPVLHIRAAA